MNKLAIVGLSNGSWQAPWTKPGYDCWTLNSAWQTLDDYDDWPRLTAWFELHSRRYLAREWAKSPVHVRRLRRLPVPCYVQDARAWPELRQPITFPRAHLRRVFPRGDYHASSIDWMVAFGIFSGYKEIGIWGVNFGPTDGGEPLSARACLEYWIGFAEGRGVKVTIHEPTGLFWILNYRRERIPYHYDDTWRLVEERRAK